jgi:hypothetical protein
VGVASERVHTDRLYAGLDQLLPYKAAIEAHLKARLGDLFDLKYDLLLYDVTSTYFEGQCLGNPMAKRGYSRDSRPDCPQVCIGLVVTEGGMPLGYEVFDGNTGDVTTVEQIVEAMEAKYGRARRVWVMDRGMVSEANLAFIRGRGGSYIVGTPKAMLRQFERYLVDKDWREVQAGVEVKLVPGPDGQETFILARSGDRREKEKAMHERFLDRMEEGLRKLAASAASGRLKDAGEARERLGRLRERYWRAGGAFEVTIAVEDAGPVDAGRRPGRRAADGPGRVRPRQERRRGADDPHGRPAAGQDPPATLCHVAGRGPKGAAEPLGPGASTTPSPDRRGCANVVTTFVPKRPWRGRQGRLVCGTA